MEGSGPDIQQIFTALPNENFPLNLWDYGIESTVDGLALDKTFKRELLFKEREREAQVHVQMKVFLLLMRCQEKKIAIWFSVDSIILRRLWLKLLAQSEHEKTGIGPLRRDKEVCSSSGGWED